VLAAIPAAKSHPQDREVELLDDDLPDHALRNVIAADVRYSPGRVKVNMSTPRDMGLFERNRPSLEITSWSSRPN
jgi:hypothetical protein